MINSDKVGERSMKKKILTILVILALITPCFTFNVMAVDAYEQIEIKNFDKNLSYLANNLEMMSNRVGSLYPKSWLAFPNMDFGDVSPTSITALSSARASYGTGLNFHLDDPDGPIIAFVPLEPVDFSVGEPKTAPLNMKVTGVHTIYVRSVTGTLNAWYFQFNAPPAKKFSYDTYDGNSSYEYSKFDSLNTDSDILWQLGILRDEKGTLLEETLPVSRGEFADSIYGIMQKREPFGTEEPDPLKAEEKKPETGFMDVEADSEVAEAIRYVSQNGVMNGVANGIFEPRSFIKNIDAATVLLRILGYERLANENGGYPNGYIKLATRAKLINDNNINEVMRRSDLINMISTALETDFVSAFTVTGDGYVKYEKIDGIMEVTQKLYRGQGRVIATPITGLYSPDSNLSADTVNIDGVTYRIGNSNALPLIGYECEFFYEYDDGSDTRTLRAIAPDSNVEFTAVSSNEDNILEITDDKIVYEREGENKKYTIEIDDKTSVIYNGVAADNRLTKLLSNPAKPISSEKTNKFHGFIYEVENSDKSRVVFVEEYEDYIIERIDPTLKSIAGKGMDGELSWSNDDYVVLKDEFGESMLPKAIAAGDVLTAYASKNKKGVRLIRLYKHVEEFVGTVTSKDSDGNLYIDGLKRSFANNGVARPQLGQKAVFVCNIYSDIVEIKVADPNNWKTGILIGKAKSNNGFDKSYAIKVMTPELKAENYYLAENITADGLRVNGDVRWNGDIAGIWVGINNISDIIPIRYRLNKDGKVSAIDTPNKGSSLTNTEGDDFDLLTKMQYNSEVSHVWVRSSQTLFQSNGNCLFYLPKTAKVFAIYDGDDIENNCLYGAAETMLSNDEQDYDFYSTSGNAYLCDLVVWKSRQDGSLSWANEFIFDSYVDVLNSDGEAVKAIRGWTGGAMEEFYAENSDKRAHEIKDGKNSYKVFNNLKPGDIVNVKYYPDKMIYSITPILFNDGKYSRTTADGTSEYTARIGMKYDPSDDIWQYVNPTNNYKNCYVYGEVIEKTDNYIVVQDPSGATILVGNCNNICSVSYREDGDCLLKNISAINISKGDTVYAMLYYGDVRSIIVYSAN